MIVSSEKSSKHIAQFSTMSLAFCFTGDSGQGKFAISTVKFGFIFAAVTSLLKIFESLLNGAMVASV